MAKHYSEHFDIDHKYFVDKGIYDGYVDKDSQLHVDPMLLKGSDIPEFKDGYKKFIEHFNKVIILAKNVKEQSKKDKFYRDLVRYLQFKEIPNTGFGFSKTGKGGTGISGKISIQLAGSAIDIVNAGVYDPEIFAISHFIEERIGSDRISDMVLSILHKEFLRYTERMSSELGIKCQIHEYDGDKYKVPIHNRKQMIFIPCAFLCKMPIARSFDEIDDVCSYNSRLRKKVSEVIGINWKDVLEMKKHDLKDNILSRPDVIDYILADYKNIETIPYDFDEDIFGEYLDIKVRECLKSIQPLKLESHSKDYNNDSLYSIAKTICEDFIYQVEDRGMWRLLYNSDTKKFSGEEAVQLVFFLAAEHHCKANNIDINRENECGRGEIDIKLSQGADAKVIIEVKRLTHAKLVQGLTNQLPAYMKSEQTDKGIFLVVIDTDKNCDNRMKKLFEARNNMTEYIPEILFVDALPKSSASK